MIAMTDEQYFAACESFERIKKAKTDDIAVMWRLYGFAESLEATFRCERSLDLRQECLRFDTFNRGTK